MVLYKKETLCPACKHKVEVLQFSGMTAVFCNYCGERIDFNK